MLIEERDLKPHGTAALQVESSRPGHPGYVYVKPHVDAGLVYITSNISGAEFTPEQAIVLADAIVEAALKARAGRGYVKTDGTPRQLLHIKLESDDE